MQGKDFRSFFKFGPSPPRAAGTDHQVRTMSSNPFEDLLVDVSPPGRCSVSLARMQVSNGDAQLIRLMCLLDDFRRCIGTDGLSEGKGFMPVGQKLMRICSGIGSKSVYSAEFGGQTDKIQTSGNCCKSPSLENKREELMVSSRHAWVVHSTIHSQ